MKKLIWITCVLVGCNTPQQSPTYPIMGELEIGPYQVGYKTHFIYDQSRTSIPYSDWDGRLYYDNKQAEGRQYQINVWYPAQENSGSNLTYSHYVHLLGRQTNFEDTETQRAFGEQIFIDHTNDLGADGKFTENQLNQLMELSVTAMKDAKELKEVFPVVIFPNNSSPAFQSITAEYLASHGYLVVGFAPKGRFAYGLDVSTEGISKAVDDLEFVLGFISQMGNGDMNQVTLMANAIASSVCVAAAAKNNQIKSLISLEGGFPSAFEQELLEGLPAYQPENLTLPMLFIYASHPAIDPKYTYHLKFADKYYVHFPYMSEFVTLNYGMFDSFLPNLIGEHGAAPKLGFEQCNLLILRFLNMQHSSYPEKFFERSFWKESRVIDTTFVLKAIPVAPNLAMMKNMFVERGFDAVDSTYRSLKQEGNLQPFSQAFIVAYRSWLAWEKDPNHANRLKLYQLAYDSYPESTLINYYLGRYSGETGNETDEKRYYKQSLSLIDDDTSLDANEKIALKKALLERLE